VFNVSAERVVYKVALTLGPNINESDIWEHARRMKDLLAGEYPDVNIEGILYRLPLGEADDA
jgi:hypothetical protein